MEARSTPYFFQNWNPSNEINDPDGEVLQPYVCTLPVLLLLSFVSQSEIQPPTRRVMNGHELMISIEEEVPTRRRSQQQTH
jgi:hypothetical protein